MNNYKKPEEILELELYYVCFIIKDFALHSHYTPGWILTKILNQDNLSAFDLGDLSRHPNTSANDLDKIFEMNINTLNSTLNIIINVNIADHNNTKIKTLLKLSSHSNNYISACARMNPNFPPNIS